MVFNIQRFCVNDGPGIRTAVFIKGCPLRCLWCHNPESQSAKKELSFDASKCKMCRVCQNLCPNECHHFGKTHTVDRDKCISCGSCTESYCGCLEVIGKEMTADSVLETVLRDRDFYRQSGGGLTLTGGEPMFYYQFTKELLTKAKETGLHVCMETCGFASPDEFFEIKDYVDIFLYDYKETDPVLHKTYTGVSNELILNNLEMLDKAGSKTILRCPIIPGYNDREDHLSGIAELAERLDNLLEVNIEPYHPLGIGKCENLGRKSGVDIKTFPDKQQIAEWIEKIRSKTSKPVRKS